MSAAHHHIVLVHEIRTTRYLIPAEGLDPLAPIERQRAKDAALLAHLEGDRGRPVGEDKRLEWVCAIRVAGEVQG
jgi:hypothetical protein